MSRLGYLAKTTSHKLRSLWMPPATNFSGSWTHSVDSEGTFAFRQNFLDRRVGRSSPLDRDTIHGNPKHILQWRLSWRQQTLIKFRIDKFPLGCLKLDGFPYPTTLFRTKQKRQLGPSHWKKMTQPKTLMIGNTWMGSLTRREQLPRPRKSGTQHRPPRNEANLCELLSPIQDDI